MMRPIAVVSKIVVQRMKNAVLERVVLLTRHVVSLTVVQWVRNAVKVFKIVVLKITNVVMEAVVRQARRAVKVS